MRKLLLFVTLLFSAFLLMPFSGSAIAVDGYFEQIVKSSEYPYRAFAVDGYSWPYDWRCDVAGFTPQTPGVDISPLSSDPRAATLSPLTVDICPTDFTGDGQLEIGMAFSTNSLEDLGVWVVTCDQSAGLWVDPAYCFSAASPPCNIVCDNNYVGLWSDSINFFITVYNDPPTASINHAPTPAWNETVTLDSNANDPDGGSLTYRWSITQKPSTSSASLSDTQIANPTISFSSDQDIGDWRFQLHVDDNEGERKTFTHEFSVPNVPPNISIIGNSDIDVLDLIELEISTATDEDGGDFDIAWDLLESPPTSSYAPQSDFHTGIGSSGATLPPIATAEEDIGIWRFSVTATDNEGDSDTAEITVEVHNLPPEINVDGIDEIDIGESIQVDASGSFDPDGGDLTFQWDIIQAPQSASLFVQEGYSIDSYIDIPTDYHSAGTWIFQVTVTDNEPEPYQESDDREFTVLVDAPPEAEIISPETIGSLSFPLVLDGSDSIDPDSPCPEQVDRCHDTLYGDPVNVSPDIVDYTWTLIDVPFELWTEYPTGVVDEVFGVPAHSPTLTLDFGDLEPGEWTFQLEVFDGEGNDDFITFTVSVVDENGAPIAILNEPARYTTDVTGRLGRDVTLNGTQSLDLDNILTDGSLMPGSGITDYQWTVLEAPAGCTPPALSSGSTVSTNILYSAGDVVEPQCQGFWKVELAVTDDDSPAKVGRAETSIIIGNCPAALCIDYPTQVVPQFIEFTEDTDILIYYHLDSPLYDDPAFAAGMFTQMEVFHESDLTTPVYTSFDPNVLASDKGSNLVFQWNGYSDTLERPLAGRYTVKLTLLDYFFIGTAFTATEPDAIWIEVAEPSILPTSDSYVNFDDLSIGADGVTLDYEIAGGAGPDDLRWRIFDASDSQIFESVVPVALAGTIEWDGIVAGSTIPAGNYTAELEAYRSGSSLGVSNRHSFTVYQLSLTPSTGAVSDMLPGLFVFVNNDDDNENGASDLTENFVGEGDLIEIVITADPPMEGVLTLSSSNAAPFKLWDTAAKGTETILPAAFNLPADPVPAQLFIEGQAAAQSDLSLEFQTLDGQTLGPATIALTPVELQVMTDSNNDHVVGPGDAQTYFVGVARWDNAYSPAPAFNVRNNADPDNFIEQDPSRFYFLVRDPSANTDPAVAETITAQLETLDNAGATEDNPTDVPLVENDINSGEFVSRSQLLTSLDIQVVDDPNADDEFNAHDGSVGTIADDVAGDRTHRTEIDGSVQIAYQPVGVPAAKNWTLPVCQRSPENRRKVQLRIHVFNEPFDDVGFDHDGNAATPIQGAGDGVFNFTDDNLNGVADPTDGNGVHDAGEPSEPYRDLSNGGAGILPGNAVGVVNGRGTVVSNAQISQELRRSDIAWAQACIKTEQLGAVLVNDAPRVAGVDILLDGTVNLPGDANAIYTAYSAAMTSDVVDVFFAAPIPGAAALAFPPNNPMIAHGENSFVLMVPDQPINYRTLAHELGHIFTNQPDIATNQFIFFPSLAPQSPVVNDGVINMQRRISQTTETDARTVRPAGNLAATGNTVLKNP